jgi:hypothetical protein
MWDFESGLSGALLADCEQPARRSLAVHWLHFMLCYIGMNFVCPISHTLWHSYSLMCLATVANLARLVSSHRWTGAAS